jgi:hypothetical protein
MKVSVFTPTGKFFLGAARSALNSVLEGALARNRNDYRVSDAIRATISAVNGAIDSLLAL